MCLFKCGEGILSDYHSMHTCYAYNNGKIIEKTPDVNRNWGFYYVQTEPTLNTVLAPTLQVRHTILKTSSFQLAARATSILETFIKFQTDNYVYVSPHCDDNELFEASMYKSLNTYGKSYQNIFHTCISFLQVHLNALHVIQIDHAQRHLANTFSPCLFMTFSVFLFSARQ